jgi:hypothetical protein
MKLPEQTETKKSGLDKHVQVSEMVASAWKNTRQRWVMVVVVVLGFAAIGWAAARFLPEQIDWVRTYRPAARELLALRSPYNIKSFFYPAWILIPMLPIALLPDVVGNGVLFAVELAAILYVAIRMRAKPLSLIALLVSFPVLFLLLFGQMDWIVLLGFTLPAPLGLIFILAKPQVAVGYAVFMLVESWRDGGRFKKVLINFLPAVAFYLLSFLIWGFWFLGADPNVLVHKCNFSAGAIGIPIGLVLTYLSLKHRKMEFSLLAGVFFSPYVCVHSWTVPLFALLGYPVELVIASIGSWIMYYYGMFVR